MKQLRLLPFLIASISAAAPANAAQDDAPVVEVMGIAPNDLLNIRATASAGGLVIARFENGAALKNLGCSDVNGAVWCKVQSVDDPRIMGWAAQRYLFDPDALPPEEAPLEGETGDPE
jgi:hypothetical protein